VTELAKAGLIVLTGQRQVRGATEHFYRIPQATKRKEEKGEQRLPARA